MKRHYIQLIVTKSMADLISEARRSYLGLLWWVAEPLLYLGVFYLIFDVLLHRGGNNSVSFLLTGLVVWKWFAAAIPQCGNCILANAGLIRQIYIPKFIFPSMVVMTSTLKFFIIFALLIGFLLIVGSHPSVAWVSIPLIMGVQLLVMLAIGSVLASIVPFLPDLRMIIENGLVLLFFLSGIFFNSGGITSEFKGYLYLNPMFGIIECYRHVLLDGLWPNWSLLGLIALSSLVVCFLGVYLLQRYDRVYAKMI